MTKMVVGNWKMNGTRQDIDTLRTLCVMVRAYKVTCEVVLCPPWTLLTRFRDFIADNNITLVRIGAQDCHDTRGFGAFTGDVSATMLGDAGIGHVIVGHSERRAGHGETDAIVRAKAEAAIMAGLLPILCVGESLAERQAGQTADVLARQLQGSIPDWATADQLVIAYEPIWAIGTGKTPTEAEIAEGMALVAGVVGADFRLLYGGSVTAANAAGLLAVAGVGGVLVGGASLNAADFAAIARAAG